MIRPQIFTAKLADRVVLNEKYQHLYFELLQPNEISFDAGQYISLSLPDSSERRSYSICSESDKIHGFELLLDITPQGKGSLYLSNLQFGQEITFLAPLGVFIVPAELSTQTKQPLIFIANGSGIAPFRSMLLEQLQQKGNQNEIILYWGVRHESELVWLDDFEELMDSYPNFHFHPVISQAQPEWSLCRGRVTDCLTVHETLENADYFLCGSTKMIESVLELLASKAIPKTKIHREKFF